ncbi:MAG: prephenate dehydrogenase [Brachybacterium sp.]|nr:prephenate dehydrogenase [Brachybacterium sp.]
MNGALVPSPVRIVGTGLIGGSLGLALGDAGTDVQVNDISPGTEALAVELGVGRAVHDDDDRTAPALVIVAAPPDVAAQLVVEALRAFPDAIVADVASVKAIVLDGVRRRLGPDEGTHLARYVGAHPMAGREVAGVIAARGDLFRARPFVIVPHETTRPEAISLLRAVATEIGSVPLVMDAATHDTSVAHVSHVPQVMSSLLASTLLGVQEQALGLAGQGLRDTTRIAASDPRLWVEIIGANATAVTPVLTEVRDRIDDVLAALGTLEGDPDPRVGSRRAIAQLIDDGNRGVGRIPGKHGGASDTFATITVLVPDRPGELARLLGEIGQIGVNLEDLRLEHTLGKRVGLAHVSVVRTSEELLIAELGERGWTVVTS